MKRSRAALAVGAALILGFVAGLFFAAYKGGPPLPARAPAPQTESLPAPSHDVEAELAALEKRLQAEPENAALLVDAGNFCFDHELYTRAIEYYQQALEVGGENPNVLTDLGISYRRTGRPEKAVALFRRARKADPGHAFSALNLGVVLLHDLNDQEGALQAWREYLALEPQGQSAEMIRRVVARLESQLGAGAEPEPE